MEKHDLTDSFARLEPRPDRGQRDYWDNTLSGFGLRVSAGNARTWQIMYRHEGRKRRLSLGPFPKLDAAAARRLAIKKMGAVLNGEDPGQAKKIARQTPTVRELAVTFLAEARTRKLDWKGDESLFRTLGVLSYPDDSVSSLARFKLGDLRVSAVTTDDIRAIHGALNSIPYRANRALSLPNALFNRAIESKWRRQDNNPCKFVKRNHEDRRERFLDTDEIKRLIEVLNASTNQRSADAVRLLILTGSRRGEVLKARWGEIDLNNGVWVRPSSHTKQRRTSRIPLSSITINVLQSMRAADPDGEFLFPGTGSSGHLKDIKNFWRTVRKRAELPDLRLHDLRHSFASVLIARGMTLPVIGKLLGHYTSRRPPGTLTCSTRLCERQQTASPRRWRRPDRML